MEQLLNKIISLENKIDSLKNSRYAEVIKSGGIGGYDLSLTGKSVGDKIGGWAGTGNDFLYLYFDLNAPLSGSQPTYDYVKKVLYMFGITNGNNIIADYLSNYIIDVAVVGNRTHVVTKVKIKGLTGFEVCFMREYSDYKSKITSLDFISQYQITKIELLD